MKLLIVLLIFCKLCFAQNEQSPKVVDLNKNSIILNAQTMILAYGGGVEYQRLFALHEKIYTSLAFSGHVQRFDFLGVSEYYALLIKSGILLNPDGNHHFEANGGLGWQKEINYANCLLGSCSEHSESRSVIPVANIAYRYQRPGGNFIFRMGVGYPELLFVSLLGVSF